MIDSFVWRKLPLKNFPIYQTHSLYKFDWDNVHRRMCKSVWFSHFFHLIVAIQSTIVVASTAFFIYSTGSGRASISHFFLHSLHFIHFSVDLKLFTHYLWSVAKPIVPVHNCWINPTNCLKTIAYSYSNHFNKTNVNTM